MKANMGKNRCRYVVQKLSQAQIVYGHTARTPEEFAKIGNEAWSELFTEVPVKRATSSVFQAGRFTPLIGGIVILETQQNSDWHRTSMASRTDDAGNLVLCIFNKQKMS